MRTVILRTEIILASVGDIIVVQLLCSNGQDIALRTPTESSPLMSIFRTNLWRDMASSIQAGDSVQLRYMRLEVERDEVNWALLGELLPRDVTRHVTGVTVSPSLSRGRVWKCSST